MKTSNRTTKLSFLDWLFLIFIGTFLLLFNYKSKAQPVVDWKINYNNVFSPYDKGLAIVTDNDCNSYIAGTTWNGVNFDYLVIKLDMKGDTVWTQSINGTGNGHDTPTAMTMDVNENLFITGESTGSGLQLDYLTIKVDSQTGQVLNSHRAGNSYDDHPSAISMAAGGDVIVTGYGYFHHANYSNEDFYTVRYNNSLVLQCEAPANAGFDRSDIATTLIVDTIAGIYLPFGNSYENGSYYWMVNEVDPYIGGCSSSENTSGGTINDYSVYASLLTSNNKVFVVGTWDGDAVIRRYNDSNGLFVSSEDYHDTISNGGSTTDAFTSILQKGNHIFVCGYVDADPGPGENRNIIVARYNINALQGAGQDWVSIPFNGPGNGNDMPVAIFMDNSPVPSVYVVANTIRAGGLKEMIVLKYNSATGALSDTIEVTNTTLFDEICTGAARDNYGNIILTGYNDDPSGHQLIAAKICTNNFNPIITWTALNTLSVTSGDSYQWFLNGNLLTGEDNQTINIGPFGNGNYVCEVTKFCCTFNTSTVVATTGIEDNQHEDMDLQVYPNPATDYIDIKWNNELLVEMLLIYDMTGRVVYEVTQPFTSNRKWILTQNWTPGVYYVVINTNGNSYKCKMIKV